MFKVGSQQKPCIILYFKYDTDKRSFMLAMLICHITEKMPELFNLDEEEVSFCSWSQKFQSVMGWSCCFWTDAKGRILKDEAHGGTKMLTLSLSGSKERKAIILTSPSRAWPGNQCPLARPLLLERSINSQYHCGPLNWSLTNGP